MLCFLLVACNQEPKAKKVQQNLVQVLTLEPQDVPISVELSGRVNALKKAEVRPQVGGILQKQLFTEGSQVTAGQSLYKIDPATYKAEVQSAQAALNRAQASLTQAKLRRDRRLGLLGSHAVSKQAMEDAEAEYLQAKADVSVCQAKLVTAEIQLRYTDVLAPITGRIGKSQMTQGALVTANQAEPLAIIQQVDPIYVDMTRQSHDLLRMRERIRQGEIKRQHTAETEVELFLAGNYPYPLKGKLKFADISVDESTGMVLLRAVFPNPEQILWPGLYVRAIVHEGIEEGVLLVPERCVARNARGEASVFVLGPDNKAQLRVITTANRVGKNIIVTSGLAQGERVVVEGYRRLRDGDILTIQSATKK